MNWTSLSIMNAKLHACPSARGFRLPTRLARSSGGLAAGVWLWAGTALALTAYVDPASPSPAYPYTTWSNAAHEIEAVIGIKDVSTVMVANGVYTPPQSLDVYRDITVQSVNGPDFTIIDGSNMVDRFFCVFMSHSGATVDGFTLRHASEHGAMIYAGTLRNCVLESNGKPPPPPGTPGIGLSGAGAYISGTQARMLNCTVRNNQAGVGGGVYLNSGLVSNCHIYANRTYNPDGGAGIYMSDGTVADCLISNNSSFCEGGFEACGEAGGILVTSRGLIERCQIVDNFAANCGGGIIAGWGTGDALIIRDCLIRGNSVNVFAGGLYLYNGARVFNCTIVSNRVKGLLGDASDKGGGIFANWGSNLIDHCTITDNSAAYAGGGVYLANDTTVSDTTIQRNSAGGIGGGMVIRNGCLVDRCLIADNVSTQGAGVYGVTTDDPSTLRNCVIRDNRASTTGGAVRADWGLSLLNCTVVSNRATQAGGGIVCDGADVDNCIVYYNSAPSGSNWVSSAAPSWGHVCTVPAAGINPVTNGPGFVSLAARDLRLTAASSCVDAGLVLPSVTRDFNGVPRPLDGNANGAAAWDIGAFEYAGGADTDGDGLTDSNEVYAAGTSPAVPDTDGDGARDGDESIAGTNPTNPLSFFRVEAVSAGRTNRVYVQTASNRVYGLERLAATPTGTWAAVSGQTNVAGNGQTVTLNDSPQTATSLWYRVRVRLAP